MTENNDIRQELEDGAPNLSRMSKSEPYSAPEGYFDRFPLEMSDRIASTRKRESVTWGIVRPKWLPVAAVAMVLLIAGIAAIFYKTNPQTQPEVIAQTEKASALNTDAPADVIDAALDEMDENTLVEELASVSRKSVHLKPEKKQQLEDYILDNTDETVIEESL